MTDHPKAASVRTRKGELVVQLKDGRTLSVPLRWFPRLRHATAAKLANYRLIGDGVGIHWPDLDEDLSVQGLLAPRASAAPRKSA